MSSPQHVFQVSIRGTAEEIWESITNPERTVQYFHETRIESDWRVGARVVYRNADGASVVEGEVVEVERPRRLSYTWKFLHDPEEFGDDSPSRVTWEIEPAGDTCTLTLTHDAFEGETKTYLAVGEGWPPLLESMKSLVETGSAQAAEATR